MTSGENSVNGFSHLSLISAENVRAFYDENKHQTKLSADVTVYEITTGVAFTQDTIFGGYKFELKGWVGPMTGNDSTYPVSNSFDIQWPNSVAPGGKVTIVTRNHPEGQDIEVEAIGGLKIPILSDTNAAGQPQQVAGPGEIIQTTEGTPFSIRQTIDDPRLGHNIDAAYNKEYLNLISASVKGKDIVWTFEAIKLGETQVVVSVGNLNPPFVYISPYHVHIGVLDSGNKS